MKKDKGMHPITFKVLTATNWALCVYLIVLIHVNQLDEVGRSIWETTIADALLDAAIPSVMLVLFCIFLQFQLYAAKEKP